MPLYDILNEFQKGSSHLAAVVKVKRKSTIPHPTFDKDKFKKETLTNAKSDLTAPLLAKQDDKSGTVLVDIEKAPRPTTNKQTVQQNGVTTNGLLQPSEDIEDGEVIGIITLEDVFEELLQVISASTIQIWNYLLICLTFGGSVPALSHKECVTIRCFFHFVP